MNQRSLAESNALLAAAASRAEAGELVPESPAVLAREAGIENRLAVARAVRALLARGRLAQEEDRYRLLDPRPLEPGEPASVRRPTRRRRPAEPAEEPPQPPTYEQVGRAIIDRLIELSAETAELRVALDRARDEAEAARREALESRRAAAGDRSLAKSLEGQVAELRKRLEMTEANLRTVVEAARGRPVPMEDSDARAILDVLGRKDASA